MIKKDFFRSSLIYTASSALSTGASFILLPFYTNTKLLTVPDYGALSLYIVLALLVQLVSGLCLDYYVVVSYHELIDRPAELKEKVASLNGYLLLSGLITVLGFAAFGNFYISHFLPSSNPDSYRYVMMSVLTGVFNAHFRFYNNLLIQQERPYTYFWSNVLNFVTTVFFSIVVMKMHPLTLEGPMWGRLISCFCIFVVSFSDIARNYGIALKQKFIRSAGYFCAPLLVTNVFQWILGSSYPFIIKPLLFNSEVAIFDLAVRFTLVINIVLDSLSTALSPKLFGLMRQGGDNAKEINKYYSTFNMICLVIIPFNILVLPVVLPWFIKDEKYLTAFLYFGIIGAGLVTRSIQNLFTYPIYFLKRTKVFIPINGFSALAQVVLGYLMIKYFKLYGAAFTLNIVKVITLGLYFYYCRNLLNEKINNWKMFFLPIAVMVFISFSELFISNYGLQMHLIHLFETACVAGVTYFIYRNEVNELLKLGVKMVTSRRI